MKRFSHSRAAGMTRPLLRTSGGLPQGSQTFRWLAFLYGATFPFAYWKFAGLRIVPTTLEEVPGSPFLLEVTTIVSLLVFGLFRREALAQALRSRAVRIWGLFALWALFCQLTNRWLFPAEWETPGAFRVTVISCGLGLLLGACFSKTEGCPDSLAKGLLMGVVVLVCSMLKPNWFPAGWTAEEKSAIALKGIDVGYRLPGMFAHGGGGGGHAAEFVSSSFAILLAASRRTLERWWYILAAIFLLCFTAIAGSLVRSAFLASVSMTLIWAIDLRVRLRSKQASPSLVYGVIILGIAATMVWVAKDSSMMTKIELGGSAKESVEESRLGVWTGSLKVISSSPEILLYGKGIGRGDDPHNFLLKFVQGAGLVGLALVLKFLWESYLPIGHLASEESGFLNGGLAGRYLLIAILIDGSLGGFLNMLAAGTLAMLLIGCFSAPATERIRQRAAKVTSRRKPPRGRNFGAPRAVEGLHVEASPSRFTINGP